MGTHIDLPKHFYDKGQCLNDFNPDYWFYNNVTFLELFKNNGELISASDIENFKTKIDKSTDLLIIKTGFEKYRDRDIYWQENPGINPDLANYLRNNFSNLRTIGFDFISLTSFMHRSIGKRLMFGIFESSKTNCYN